MSAVPKSTFDGLPALFAARIGDNDEVLSLRHLDVNAGDADAMLSGLRPDEVPCVYFPRTPRYE